MEVSLVLSALISCALFISISGKPPILIVPGLMGSQLVAKIRTSNPLHVLCNTGSYYELLWVTLNPLKVPCLDYLELQLRAGRFKDMNGVDVRVVGGTESVECPAPSVCLSSSSSSGSGHYMKELVQFFVGKGYKMRDDLRAAPYDWRLSPGELYHRGYYHSTMKIIESMYNKHGKKKVTIVAHSYGGPVMLYFLTHVMNEWDMDINNYVKAFIPLGAPFGGASMIVGALAFGELPVDIGSLLKQLTITLFQMRQKIRAFASMYYLAPHPEVFKRRVLLVTSKGNYGAYDYTRLFRDGIGFQNGLKWYNAANLKPKLVPPPVPTYCIYGVDIDTPIKYNSIPGKEKTVMGNGDGTVNKISLEVCADWSKKNGEVKVYPFPKESHLNIVRSQRVLKAINGIANTE